MQFVHFEGFVCSVGGGEFLEQFDHFESIGIRLISFFFTPNVLAQRLSLSIIIILVIHKLVDLFLDKLLQLFHSLKL